MQYLFLNSTSEFQKRNECRRLNLLNMLRFCAQVLFSAVYSLNPQFTDIERIKDIFKPPIRMAEDCGHNFCHTCITELIGRQRFWNCPECRSDQEKPAMLLVRNRLVEKAVESFLDSELQKKLKNICQYHNLELTLCKSDFHAFHNFKSMANY